MVMKLPPSSKSASGRRPSRIGAAVGMFRPRYDIPPSQASAGFRAQPRVVYFDGYCGLCSLWVDFLLSRDKRAVWLFSPMQTPAGAALIRAAGLPEGYTDSVLVWRQGSLHTHSTAVIVAVADLGGVYRLALVLLAIPAFVRDPIYALVARFRYRLFGRSTSCRLPTPAERSRFIQA